MKSLKIKSVLAVALGALLFSACDSDRDSNPVIDTTPTEFTLNTPDLTDQYVDLNKDSKLDLTWSQPNYGFPVVATYKVQVGLVKDDNTITWQKDTATNADKFLATSYTSCASAISGKEVSQAICALDGFKLIEDYVQQDYRPIAVRIYASIADEQGNEIANTGIFSNAVVFKHLKAYNAIEGKRKIYLIGQPQTWAEPSAANQALCDPWALEETGIGTNIYEGTFEIPAGQFQFRFYKALTGWDGGDSYGAQADDSPVDVTMTDGVYQGAGVTGKGSWQISDWAGGKVAFTIDLNKNTVKFATVGSAAKVKP